MTVAAEKKAETSVERVYDQVKQMAIGYLLRPNERVNEAELSKQLKVSRTPLREALNRLAMEGFLTIKRNRGFFGRSLDAKHIFDLYEFRATLERAIIRLVCERATDKDLDELEAYARAHMDTKDDDKAEDLLRIDEAFHLRLAVLSRNEEFVRSLAAINSRIHFVRWIDLQNRRATQGLHLGVVKLIRTRDADRCAEHIGEHISRRYDQIVEVIKRGISEIYLNDRALS